MPGLPADAATKDAAVRWLLSCRAATVLPRLLEPCRSHGRAGSAMVDETCLRCCTGISSATTRALLCADCREPAPSDRTSAGTVL